MKLMVLCAFLSISCSVHAVSSILDESEWQIFKIAHAKLYHNETEENFRKGIFVANLNFIRQHNRKYERGEVTYVLEVNEFTDLTSMEVTSTMMGLRLPQEYINKGVEFEVDDEFKALTEVDWRKQKAVSPVKHQGDCGACWAFSATGSLEGQTFLKDKSRPVPSLSEQNLIDCSRKYGTDGCNGGHMIDAFRYIKDNNGINPGEAYPYEEKEGKCRFDPKKVAATCTGYVEVPRGEPALEQAVTRVGPISVGIDANHSSFIAYKKGVYKEPNCNPEKLGHGVLVVGYGSVSEAEGGDYWIVKNSWGTGWGMQGYMMLARNRQNMCGIATDASYPTV